MKFPFGSLMYYVSPVNGAKTRCLYIRDDHGKAVVFFEHAEWAARVGYDQLEKNVCLNFTSGGIDPSRCGEQS